MFAMIPMFLWLSLFIGLGFTVATSSEHIGAAVIAIVGAALFTFVGKKVANDEDRAWLPNFIMVGFAAKLAMSWLRWWVLVDYYRGSGDAVGFHGNASRTLVHMWRSFDFPDMKIGTEAMNGVTGLVYVPYIPSMLGGFFEFAILAFIGQIFMYAAFRKSVVPRRLKLYAFAVFLIPNVVYWPSSIGKEAVMFLGIGIAAYGIAKLLADGALSSAIPIVIGMGISGIIRPHVSAMQAAAAVGALLFAKGGVGVARMPAKRLALLSLSGAGLAIIGVIAASSFGIALEDAAAVEGQVDTLVTSIEDQTSKGGSQVEGGFITSPAEFPEAAVRVLFRPLPYEANNPPAFAASLEGAVLLLILLWKLPAMFRRGLRIRRDPYTLFCLFFTIGFVIAFSSFLNLGLMARERSQVLPFMLALLVALGFGPPDIEEEERQLEEERKVEGIDELLIGGPLPVR